MICYPSNYNFIGLFGFISNTSPIRDYIKVICYPSNNNFIGLFQIQALYGTINSVAHQRYNCCPCGFDTVYKDGS